MMPAIQYARSGRKALVLEDCWMETPWNNSDVSEQLDFAAPRGPSPAAPLGPTGEPTKHSIPNEGDDEQAT